MLRSMNGRKDVLYLHMKVEPTARNVYLQAFSLGLGTVVIGAFNDDEVQRLLLMPDDEWAQCILPMERG